MDSLVKAVFVYLPCVVLHSGALDRHVKRCVRPPINFLTTVGCVGLFLSDLLGSCLLSIRLDTGHASGFPMPIRVDGEWQTVPADLLYKV